MAKRKSGNLEVIKSYADKRGITDTRLKNIVGESLREAGQRGLRNINDVDKRNIDKDLMKAIKANIRDNAKALDLAKAVKERRDNRPKPKPIVDNVVLGKAYEVVKLKEKVNARIDAIKAKIDKMDIPERDKRYYLGEAFKVTEGGEVKNTVSLKYAGESNLPLDTQIKVLEGRLKGLSDEVFFMEEELVDLRIEELLDELYKDDLIGDLDREEILEQMKGYDLVQKLSVERYIDDFKLWMYEKEEGNGRTRDVAEHLSYTIQSYANI